MSQRNEGEGNKTAARRYNEGTRRFSRSGQVTKQAKAARKALEGGERESLEEAEAIGRSHAKGEDPTVRTRNR